MTIDRSLTRLQVGNEFSSVEALWSQFEGVMAKDQEEDQQDDQEDHPGTGGDNNNNRGNDAGGDGEGEDEDEADRTAIKSE